MSGNFCRSCGSAINDGAKFCPVCGKPAALANENVQNTAYYQQPAPNPAQAYQNNNAYQPYSPPVDTQPLSVGSYIGMFFLSALPLAGFILLLMWAFGSNVNINKRNYARAILLMEVIVIVVYVILIIAGVSLFANLFSNFDTSSFSSY